MLQTTKRWLYAAALLAVPLATAGCGGGGSSSSAAPAGFDINAKVSQTSVASPRTVKTMQGTAQIFTQGGYNTIFAGFGDDPVRLLFTLGISTRGILKSGDIFVLNSNNTGVDPERRILAYGDFSGGDQFTKLYIATSGTFRINGLVNRPAVGARKATTTVNFTLSNVQLKPNNSIATEDLLLNATGRLTADNLGDLK